MSSDNSADVIRAWSESARYWDKHRAAIEVMFGPVTEALIEEARIAPGHSVLDVAAGSGEPTLTVAARFGPGVKLTATDPVSPMLSAAAREASRRGLANVSFAVCPAESLPFPDDVFDAVVCRFGAMFFPDVLAALRGILRVTRSERRMVFAVWSKPEANPFFSVITNVIASYVPPVVEEPDAPGAFRFAEPGRLARLLGHAGAVAVRDSILKFRIAGPMRLEEFWSLRTELSDTLRQKLVLMSGDQIRSAKQDVESAAREYFQGGRMSFPAEVILVSAEKPASGIR
ncbi:MAG TPA: methyltransferase domain-containing protein [Blastocatellia bacterium]|nr:methyltransferase domain-containing protein [Blastocatellia bacterium]